MHLNEEGETQFYIHWSSKGTFCPFGIITDSKSRILTADCLTNRIHIFDQNGIFLKYIDNRHLQRTWGLCLDTRDNIFVPSFLQVKFSLKHKQTEFIIAHFIYQQNANGYICFSNKFKELLFE